MGEKSFTQPVLLSQTHYFLLDGNYDRFLKF